MPEDMDPEAAKHITPVLKQVMSKILHGGGLGKAGLNFTTLFLQLQGVAMSYQLCIPPYFTNVLRAFGTIEGIALKVDPDYGIVQECMPYLSRRLLTDNNPRWAEMSAPFNPSFIVFLVQYFSGRSCASFFFPQDACGAQAAAVR